MARNQGCRTTLFLSAARAFQHTMWQPSVDVYRTPDGWLLKYELAGVLPGDVQITLSGHSIAVRGMRRDVRIDERMQSYSMEISYNQFERALALPCDVSQMLFATEYHDGMLVVRLTHRTS
jgi:HSP20 family protein